MARRKQETLTLFPEVADTTRKLTDAQFGALIRAAFAYRFRGEAYAGEDAAVDMAFQFLASQIDRYQAICATNRNNASSALNASEMQRNTAESNGTPLLSTPIQSNPSPSPKIEGTDKPSRSRFVPPSAQEVKDYCQEKGYQIDPDRFVAYYEATGWTRGKTKIKDWRACVRTWVQQSKGASQPTLSRDTYMPPESSSRPFWEEEPPC